MHGSIDARGLPENALDAAADFHNRTVPAVRAAVAVSSDVAVVFEPAEHAHRAWRISAIQGLARELAPRRVNGIVAGRGDARAIAETMQFLRESPGITGQILEVDANPPENG